MAESKKAAAAATEAAEERVEIFIERDSSNGDPNLFVSVNGVNYLLPRGQISKVPKHIYDEIMRSRRAQAALDARMDAMSK